MIIAFFGRNRKIGFRKAFLVSLLLSPLIGLIAVIVSETREELLIRLKISYDSGNLTREEYDSKVGKLSPTKEDKVNEVTGYAVVFGIIVIIYVLYRFLL